MNDLGWLSAAPDGGEGEDADQIVNTAPKVLDFLGRVSGLPIHISGRWRRTTPASSPLAKFSQELIRRYKEGILLKDAPDDDHGMSSHDVNHRVPPKLTKMVSADDGVVVPKPHLCGLNIQATEIEIFLRVFLRALRACLYKYFSVVIFLKVALGEFLNMTLVITFIVFLVVFLVIF